MRTSGFSILIAVIWSDQNNCATHIGLFGRFGPSMNEGITDLFIPDRAKFKNP